jgi:hypothetical protein
MRDNIFGPLILTCDLLFCFLISGNLTGQSLNTEKSDTSFISFSGDLKFEISRKHQYHQTLTMKFFMSQAMFDGKYKRRDNGKSELFLTCEQALDVIRRLDNLTLGIPKIVYLVGWQYNGHDSKYPAWFEGNDAIKRPQDTSAIASIKWLMKEAAGYNTTVSLHLNMFDAYEDSPLWDQYLKNDIIARNPDGTLRACEWGYPVSYAREWNTGFARKRIDSICSLLPLENAGTVHIDAFHSWPPVPVADGKGGYRIDLSPGPISPYLGNSIEDETEAQRNIFRYWASKGIDVTSEGVDFLRETAFEGFQPMAWWYGGGLRYYLKWPASYYSGGQDNSDWGKLFGTSMHGEDIVRNDYSKLSGFKEAFCLKTVIWYYLNRLNRLYVVNTKSYKAVGFSSGVKTVLSGGQYKISGGKRVLAENDDIFIPALWINNASIIAYSKYGYNGKSWTLPCDWPGVKSVKLYKVSDKGREELGALKVNSGIITLSMLKDEMLLIVKDN